MFQHFFRCAKNIDLSTCLAKKVLTENHWIRYIHRWTQTWINSITFKIPAQIPKRDKKLTEVIVNKLVGFLGAFSIRFHPKVFSKKLSFFIVICNIRLFFELCSHELNLTSIKLIKIIYVFYISTENFSSESSGKPEKLRENEKFNYYWLKFGNKSKTVVIMKLRLYRRRKLMKFLNNQWNCLKVKSMQICMNPVYCYL